MGIYTELFPPKAKWSTKQIPDLAGKVAIVTGGNSGIGRETVKALLEHNAKVYILSRNKTTTGQAIEELRKQTQKQAFFIQVDLSDLKSVKRAAEEYLRTETELHILFNNAGILDPPIDAVTSQGYDMQFGTNAFGPFYLTKLLTPTLLATARTSPDKHVRVVNTAAMTHRAADPEFHFDAIKDGAARKKLGLFKLYAQSKFATIVLAAELGRRYGDQGIVAMSCNPGVAKTAHYRNLHGVGGVIMGLLMHSAEVAAVTPLRAGTAAEGREWNGKYLIPQARIGEPSKGTQDPVLGKKLWDFLEEEVKDI